MADLVAIDPEPAGAGVVAYLEQMLERARAGEFSAVAIAFTFRDGSTGSGFSQQHNLATIVGAVAALQAKLIAEMVQ